MSVKYHGVSGLPPPAFPSTLSCFHCPTAGSASQESNKHLPRLHPLRAWKGIIRLLLVWPTCFGGVLVGVFFFDIYIYFCHEIFPLCVVSLFPGCNVFFQAWIFNQVPAPENLGPSRAEGHHKYQSRHCRSGWDLGSWGTEEVTAVPDWSWCNAGPTKSLKWPRSWRDCHSTY